MLMPVVIDSDAFNEIDDQFAIAYALRKPQTLLLMAIFAAPFVNEKAATPKEGMEKSLNEIWRICALCQSDVPVYAGSAVYLPEDGSPVQSPACDALIRLARAMPLGNRLYVAAIATLTNVASALIKAPDLKDRIAVYWLGTHAKDFQNQYEFNLRQDRRAAQAVFDSGVPVVWFPCCGVCSHLSISVWEAEHWLRGQGELAEALLSLLIQSGAVHIGQSRVLWDIAPIAALCNSKCIETIPVPCPVVTESPLRLTPGRHEVEYVQMIARDSVFADFLTAVTSETPMVQPGNQ